MNEHTREPIGVYFRLADNGPAERARGKERDRDREIRLRKTDETNVALLVLARALGDRPTGPRFLSSFIVPRREDFSTCGGRGPRFSRV
ncbi:hypothetical protein WN55_00438 [Dufourea novaeangliae]|uniref:Uncharacterized protein n=1 Tax=Dufourea novaeangliae TaxID=178035 RepID=A0A154PFM8_DUFNO|nr:hypothetical protein WN55_00438 [Dufourea novaeangliae]